MTLTTMISQTANIMHNRHIHDNHLSVIEAMLSVKNNSLTLISLIKVAQNDKTIPFNAFTFKTVEISACSPFYVSHIHMTFSNENERQQFPT